MANEMWHVTVDGTQLPDEQETAQVRDLLARSAGKDVLVWTPGMAEWADPLTLPQFKAAAAPKPAAPAPAPAAQPAPRPAPAPAAARAVSPAPVSSAPRRAPLPVSADELNEQAGVFKALLDTSFETLLTPKLIKAVYILVMVVLALAVAAAILTSLAGFRAGIVTGLIGLVIAAVVVPFAAVLYLAIVRMSLEVVMAVFKIKEYTGYLAERARQADSGKD